MRFSKEKKFSNQRKSVFFLLIFSLSYCESSPFIIVDERKDFVSLVFSRFFGLFVATTIPNTFGHFAFDDNFFFFFFEIQIQFINEPYRLNQHFFSDGGPKTILFTLVVVVVVAVKLN